MLSRFVASTGLCLLVVGALPACEETKQQAPSAASSASAQEGPKGVDPNIAKAVESAAAKADAGGPADGPPPNGVFGPGEADKAHPANAPRRLELFESGTEPRVTLRGGSKAKAPTKLRMTVAQRIGPQAMPTLDYTLGVKLGTPKAAGDDEGADAPAGPPQVVLTVKDVQLAKTQPGAVPRDLDKEVSKLKGSAMRGQLAPDGGLATLDLEPAKTADEGLRPALEALMGAVETCFLPAPDKPVGVGAYWMVVDRARPAGLEMLRYRVYRVTELEGKYAKLSLDLRHYSVGGVVTFPGAPDGLVLNALAVNSAGKGNIVAAAGSPVPLMAEIGLPVQMQMEAKERPGQAMVLQVEMAFRLESPELVAALGKDDDAAPDDAAPDPTATPKPKATAAPAPTQRPRPPQPDPGGMP